MDRPRTKQIYEGQLRHIPPTFASVSSCDMLRQSRVRITGASAERMIERALLTWDDVRALAGAINPRFECLVWTAAASSLRFGELAGLSVDHVNLDRSELRVSRALNDIKGVGPTLGPPTTDRSVRTVLIHESVTLRLVDHLDLSGDSKQADSLVFTSLRGGRRRAWNSSVSRSRYQP